MKFKFSSFLILAIAVAGTTCIQACKNSDKPTSGNTEKTNQVQADSTKKDNASTYPYICAMKCEGSGSNTPGKCKVCGMDLVKTKQ